MIDEHKLFPVHLVVLKAVQQHEPLILQKREQIETAQTLRGWGYLTRVGANTYKLTQKGRDFMESDLMNTTVVAAMPTDNLPAGARTDPHIEEMFDAAMVNSPNNVFLEDLYSWWQSKGFLTKAQYETLQKRCEED